MPRLTLTSRAGENRASCAISAEPIHPEPPVTSIRLPCRHPARTGPGRSMSFRTAARNLPYSSCASGLLASSARVSLARRFNSAPVRRGLPRGTASCISAMISAAVCTMLSIGSASKGPAPALGSDHAFVPRGSTTRAAARQAGRRTSLAIRAPVTPAQSRSAAQSGACPGPVSGHREPFRVGPGHWGHELICLSALFIQGPERSLYIYLKGTLSTAPLSPNRLQASSISCAEGT